MAGTFINLLGVLIEQGAPSPLLEPLRLLYDRPALHRPPRHRLSLSLQPGRRNPGPSAFALRTHTSRVLVTPETDWSVWIHGHRQDVHLKVGPQHSTIELCSEGDAEFDEALMVALIEVLRAQGVLPLHAAVLERRGQALALFGPSGTGKSTTMLRALQAGYRPITEDYALYEPDSGLIYGLDLGLRCLPDTLARVQAAFPLSGQPEQVRGKMFVSWEMLGLEQVWHATFSAASALRRDAAVPSGELKLALPQRVMTLWAATGVPLLPSTREWTNTQITHLAQDLKWSERILGSTPVAFAQDGWGY